MSTFVEENVRRTEDETTKIKIIKTIKSIFTNYICQAVTFFIIFSFAVPTLIYFWMNDLQEIKASVGYYCAVKNEYKVKCGFENISYKNCLDINCCYDDLEHDCYHSAPSKYGYSVLPNDTNTFYATQTKSPYGSPIEPTIKLSVIEESENIVNIILHNSNFISKVKLNQKNYAVQKNIEKLGVDVYRLTGEKVLTTSRGPLIVSETYWEWAIQLTENDLFGLGDLLLNYSVPFTKIIYKNEKDHTTIASFLAHQGGNYHGLVIEHEGPLEVTVLPSKLIVLKCLAGDFIRLNLFIGPTPNDVFLQQRKFQPKKLPKWIFGTHICRNMEVSSLSNIIEVFKVSDYGSDCIHEDLMIYYLLENNQQVIELLKTTISNMKTSMKFQFPLLPMIPIGDHPIYKRAQSLKVLYEDENNLVWEGIYANKSVAYIDFTSKNILDFMKSLIYEFDNLGADSYILLNNWPKEDTFIFENNNSYFQYINNELNQSLSNTIPWYLKNSKLITHLKLHNDYTKMQTAAIKVITNKPLIVSSYQYGMEELAIVQNPYLSWKGFENTLALMLYHSTQINPLISNSMCGSRSMLDSSNVELCTRWYVTSASLPFFLTSHEWPKDYTEYHLNIVQNAIILRKQLSFYYYNYLARGLTLIRPMFFNFPNDKQTLGIKNQYMLGNFLLVYQPVLPKLSIIEMYFPEVEGGWYEFWGGKNYEKIGWNTFNFVESDWIMFIRSGSVLPLKDVENKDNINILVALNCFGMECVANGELLLENFILSFQIINNNLLRVSNIKEAKTDIGCSTQNPKHAFKIHGIHVLFNQGELSQLNILSNVDLCQQTEDYVDIELWQL